MNNIEKYKKKQEAMMMVSAFALFIDKGIEAVERMYPQYADFVLSNQGKSKTQVKNELLQTQAVH